MKCLLELLLLLFMYKLLLKNVCFELLMIIMSGSTCDDILCLINVATWPESLLIFRRRLLWLFASDRPVNLYISTSRELLLETGIRFALVSIVALLE